MISSNIKIYWILTKLCRLIRIEIQVQVEIQVQLENISSIMYNIQLLMKAYLCIYNIWGCYQETMIFKFQ